MIKRHKHRGRQAVINYLLSFILALSIIVTIISIVGKVSFASEDAILTAGDQTRYYYSLKNEIEQKAMDFAVPFGINQKCLKKVFDYKQIRSDVKVILDKRIDQENGLIDFSDIERRIKKNVEAKEGTLNDKQLKSLDTYIKKVRKMYYKKIHFPTEDTMVEIIDRVNHIIIISIPVSVVVMILCIFYLIVSRHYAYHGLRFVAYGVLGAGAFLSLVFAAMIQSENIYNYNISDAFMKKFYVYWIGHPFLMSLVCGIGTLLLGAIVIFLVYRQKYAIKE